MEPHAVSCQTYLLFFIKKEKELLCQYHTGCSSDLYTHTLYSGNFQLVAMLNNVKD
jgi:hypothetical protein